MSSRGYTCASPGCDNKARRHGLCEACGRSIPKNPADQVAADRERAKLVADAAGLKLKYATALKTIERQEQELAAVTVLRSGVAPIAIEPKEGSGTSEAVPVVVASDWHAEEEVRPETVGNLNRYDLEIAEARVKNFFSSTLRLFRLLNQDVKITTAILALLGDFIGNADLHDGEQAENMLLRPTDAIVFAQNLLIGGIEFLLEHTTYEFVIPCHSGNHARTTHKLRAGNENGHSLEYLMYLHLAAYFRDEPRVRFQIAEGYHSYLPVYDKMIRFHHGHDMRYQGGVGGIYIPVNKSIAQWNKGRHVDLDVFGHFHQLRDGGNFICNGSLVGYNAFALSIKADFELPKQALFLMDKKRGRTCTWPVLMKGDK